MAAPRTTISILIAILNPIGAIPTLSIYIINMEQEQLRRVYRLVGISVPLLMVIFAVGGRSPPLGELGFNSPEI